MTDIPRLAQAAPPGAADAIVPLGVSEQALLDTLYEHLASSTFTPDDLLARAAIVRQDRFYVPTCDARGRAPEHRRPKTLAYLRAAEQDGSNEDFARLGGAAPCGRPPAGRLSSPATTAP